MRKKKGVRKCNRKKIIRVRENGVEWDLVWWGEFKGVERKGDKEGRKGSNEGENEGRREEKEGRTE